MLRLTDQPTVRLYRGFGNDTRLTIAGHVFRRSALSRKKYRNIDFVNLLAVLRLFLVRPHPGVLVRLYFGEQVAQTQTDANGYFTSNLVLTKPLTPGWHRVRAQYVSQTLMPETVFAEDEGQVLIPYATPFICISDIDDTFLISHSATIAKRLLVLLNGERAQPEYHLKGWWRTTSCWPKRAAGPRHPIRSFTCRAVSGIYTTYILNFRKQNGLPDGIYMLSPLKRLSEVLKDGEGQTPHEV